ncbi:MAG: flagellar type III secretion system protein FliR, partial [Alphaproteobacteria bacterium]|nr:flagellar type III secretion system protein FliR [Alphaproteobacteria bacterium]
MLEQIIGVNIFLFLLIFTRVGAALMWLPGIGTAYVPVRIRLTAALLVSFAMLPALAAGLPGMPGTPSGLTILIAGEALVGTFFGLIGRVALATLQTAGTLIALFASIANAFSTDPVVEQQSSTVSGFLSLLGATLVVATDLHEVAIRALAESYGVFIPGAPLMPGDLSDAFARQVAASFALGFQMASPFLIAALIYYVGLGILGRLMPTLQVFFFGLPAQ